MHFLLMLLIMVVVYHQFQKYNKEAVEAEVKKQLKLAEEKKIWDNLTEEEQKEALWFKLTNQEQK